MHRLKIRLLPALLLALVTACQQSSSPPTTPATPALSITPASANVNAGDAPITFSAAVQSSTDTVTWTYTGPGSIALTSGPTTSYTPPASLDSTQSGTLSATLGSTGTTAIAAIVIYPADVTPPNEPPTPEPTPTPTPTPDLSVTIAKVDPLTLDSSGTAAVTLNATTGNAPSGATYKWTAQGDNSANVAFGSATAEDTTATFSAPGSYTLKLKVTAGSKSASDTVEVTVNPMTQSVQGIWDAQFNQDGTSYPFTLNLDQNGSEVTGTLSSGGTTYPVTGTFDGTKLTLELFSDPDTITLEATVSGDTMSGTISTGAQAYPFTAKRDNP